MNNPALFNAALTAASGITQPAILSDATAIDYLGYTNLVNAIATAVDNAIPVITGGPSQAQCDLLKGIVTGVFLGRYPVNAASYVTVSNAIAALFTEMNLKINTSSGAVPNTATLSTVAPVLLAAAGAGGWVDLLTFDCSAITGLMTTKVEVGIDASATNLNTSTVTEMRANRSYTINIGTPTLLNDSTVFASADLQFVIVGNILKLQGKQEAAGGNDHVYSASLYIAKVIVK